MTNIIDNLISSEISDISKLDNLTSADLEKLLILIKDLTTNDLLLLLATYFFAKGDDRDVIEDEIGSRTSNLRGSYKQKKWGESIRRDALFSTRTLKLIKKISIISFLQKNTMTQDDTESAIENLELENILSLTKKIGLDKLIKQKDAALKKLLTKTSAKFFIENRKFGGMFNRNYIDIFTFSKSVLLNKCK